MRITVLNVTLAIVVVTDMTVTALISYFFINVTGTANIVAVVTIDNSVTVNVDAVVVVVVTKTD